MLDDVDSNSAIGSIFDRLWYLHRYPDVAAAGIDPIEHYLICGANEERDPHPLFDTSWYVEQNPEVARTGINPLAHYLLKGAHEGRDPHPLFDTSWYVEQNPEVARTGINPLAHYLIVGGRDGGVPHPLFNSAWYLKNNPDVLGAGIDPLVHYVVDGDKEGRNPNPLFDTAWYLRHCPEASAVGMPMLAHYLTNGAAQGIDPHPLFDTAWYLRQLDSISLGRMSALEHYILVGAHNQLDPHPLFDSSWYLEMYPEVAAAALNPLIHYLDEGSDYGTEPHVLFKGNWYKHHYKQKAPIHLNPLVHYLVHGVEKNYDPSPSFSTRFYTKRYKDVDWTQINPFVHYVTQGRKEGRVTVPIQVLYRDLLANNNRVFSDVIFEKHRHIRLMPIKPCFTIIVSGNESIELQRTLTSICDQMYAKFDVLRTGATVNYGERLSKDRNSYLIWLEAGDVLKGTALYHLASAINRLPDLDLIYGDEEIFQIEDEDAIPFFKPSWSPDYLESFNYMGRAVCYKTASAIDFIAESENSFDLLLRVSEKTIKIAHLREMILQCPDRRFGSEVEICTDIALLNQRCRRLGWNARFAASPGSLRLYKLFLEEDVAPKISVILYDPATSQQVFDFTDFTVSKVCAGEVGSILDYPCLELLEVRAASAGVNSSFTGAEKEMLSSESNRVDRPGLSRALNSAVSIATGDYIFFVCRESIILGADMIAGMVRHFIKSNVGVVGPKLLFHDGRIMQFGLVLSEGMKRFVHYGSEDGVEDYFFSQSAVRNFRAVSLDGLLTEKDLFERVGGFDESIRDDLISVDYCLKVFSCRRHIICDPDVKIKTADTAKNYMMQGFAAQIELDELFVDKWSAELIVDPFYNESCLCISPVAYDGRQQ